MHLMRCDLHPFWKKHSHNNTIKLHKSNLDIFIRNISRTTKIIYKNDFRNKQKTTAIKTYNKKHLMKNPDFNKKLRNLSDDFLLKNADLLKLYRPVTVDLIRKSICNYDLQNRDLKGSRERVMKKVNLPDINEVRRINKSILTAQVAPITVDGSSNVSISLIKFYYQTSRLI